MKDRFFFAILALLGAGLIYYGINSAKAPNYAPLIGQNINNRIVFSTNDLNLAQGNKNFPVRPSFLVSPVSDGVRLAAEEVAIPNGENGIRFALSPQVKEQTKNHNIKIIIAARAFQFTPAKDIAIGVKNGANVIWKNAKVLGSNQSQIFDLGHSQNGIDTIFINPALEGNGNGIELLAMAIKLD
jgi:hypothetical protein